MFVAAFRGLPGAGKTTLGRELSRVLGWPMIDKDDIKDVLHGETPQAGRLAYDVMLNLVRRELQQGLSVICVSTLTFEGVYRQLEEIADEGGATLAIVDCICPDDNTLRGRIESRADRNLPEHHQTEWHRFVAYRETYFRDVDYPVAAPRLRIETTNSVEENVQMVVRWLSTVSGQDRRGTMTAIGHVGPEEGF